MGNLFSCWRELRGLSEGDEDEDTEVDPVEFYYCQGRVPHCIRCEAERNRENFENWQLRRWDAYGPEPELGPDHYFWIPTPPPPPRVAGARFHTTNYKPSA
ncbi:unnamed protein product [Orchesella dallaii]|uniref:Uncharacterized protein n=1 Tax=Orchesella dallaii TaxID=48710 RepID=A0ABP1S8K9_9HEXA